MFCRHCYCKDVSLWNGNPYFPKDLPAYQCCNCDNRRYADKKKCSCGEKRCASHRTGQFMKAKDRVGGRA